MNQLELPPRRSMPPEVRDRIRARGAERPDRTHRLRSPLAVAASVAVLVATAVLAVQLAVPNHDRTGTPSPPATLSANQDGVVREVPPPTVLPANDPRVTEALDRCGEVAGASYRAPDFPPLDTWEPAYGAELNGVLVVPYREYGDKPGVCATTDTTATVSDPSNPPMDMGQEQTTAGQPLYVFNGLLYLPESGVLAGFAQRVDSLSMLVETPSRTTAPEVALGNELYVVNVGKLGTGDRIITEIAFPGGSETAYLWWDPAKVRPVGATSKDR